METAGKGSEDEAKKGRNLELIVLAIVFLCAVGLFSLNWFYEPAFGQMLGDVSATSAERVRAGDVPYRDFWTIYSPGSFYLLALLFTVFGNHILVSAIAASVLSAAAVALCFRLVNRLVEGMVPALACAAVFLAAFYSSGYYLNLGPYPPVIFCVLLVLNFIAGFESSGDTRALYAAGLITGLAVVLKHDVGGYTAIAITLGLVAGNIGGNSGADLAGVLSRIGKYAIGVAAVVLPVGIIFAVVAGADMWRDLIVFPATDFRFARGENYPGLIPALDFGGSKSAIVFSLLESLRYSIPLVVSLVAAAVVAFAFWKQDRRHVQMAVIFALLYLVHYASAHVQINTNLISMPLYASMLGAIGYRLIDGKVRGWGRSLFRLSALGLAGVGFLAFIFQPFYIRAVIDYPYVNATLPKISGVRISENDNRMYSKLVAFVNENIPPERRIFIGLHRHDTTIIGDGATYFILDRLNATRQDQLHPGVVDTARVQREMISDLEARDVEYIFLKQHVFSDEVLDRLRKHWSITLPDSGATVLDEYIRANYKKVRTIGPYEILKRSSATGPEDNPAKPNEPAN